jgi:hypothetical protein
MTETAQPAPDSVRATTDRLPWIRRLRGLLKGKTATPAPLGNVIIDLSCQVGSRARVEFGDIRALDALEDEDPDAIFRESTKLRRGGRAIVPPFPHPLLPK